MKTILRLLYLLMIMTVCIQCHKDTIIIEENNQPISDLENVSFLIFVGDSAGSPIEGAELTVDGLSTIFTTDEYGILSVNNTSISAAGLKSTISATGFDEKIHLLYGAPNSITSIDILMNKSQTKLVDSGTEGSLGEGVSLRLPATLVDSDGGSYSGPVKVEMIYLSPDDYDFLNRAPGNMLGLNDRSEFKQLASLGMVSISLFDNIGRELQIPENLTATIKMPVAGSQQSIGVSSAPLWYFDEEKAFWVEDGEAQLNQGQWVAEVSHFTWWNCDIPYSFTPMCFNILNDRGIPLSGLDIRFFVEGLPFGHAITDEDGNILAKVPINEEISITYTHSGQLVTINTGPFSENNSKETIVLDGDYYIISGDVFGCEMASINKGYLFFENIIGGNSHLPIPQNGKFSYINPQFEHTLYLVDQEKNKFESRVIPPDAEDQFLGGIQVCEEEAVTKISGFVFLVQDGSGEDGAPVVGYEVGTIKNNTIFTPVFTDENGYYELITLPGEEVSVFVPGFNLDYNLFGSADFTPDGDECIENQGDEFEFGSNAICAIADFNEHDSDNNFIFIPKGNGTISGSVWADINDDQTADIPMEWANIIIPPKKETTTYVDQDGNYINTIENGGGYISLGINDIEFEFWSDYDHSPDPEGDDQLNGPNGQIPIFLKNEETDEHNNFVVNLKVPVGVCSILEDVDNDGIGDVPYAGGGQAFTVRANETNVAKVWEINEQGYFYFTHSKVGSELNYEVYLKLNGDYSIIDQYDTTPDNNPVPVDNEKMLITFSGIEWDAGNTFVVKKN